jgi:hypothetical protein
MRSGNGGQLNPEFVQWLMNFPKGWTDLTQSRPIYRKKKHGDAENSSRRKILRKLRKTAYKKTNKRKTRRSRCIFETEILRLRMYLQNLRRSCEEIGYVPKTLSAFYNVWRSMPYQEKNWIRIRLDSGDPWHSEWPHTPRISIKTLQRANQLKCLGNAIVPRIAMMIWQRINNCENERQQNENYF